MGWFLGNTKKGVRDFIHVQDLARGHLAALEGFLGVDQGWGGADRCRTYKLSQKVLVVVVTRGIN